MIVLGAILGGAGCETPGQATASRPDKSKFTGAYASTNRDGSREYVLLRSDGTYDRVIADRYGKTYQNKGTWQKYGDDADSARTKVGARHVELSDWAETSEIVKQGSAKNAPKIEKVLPGSVFVSP